MGSKHITSAESEVTITIPEEWDVAFALYNRSFVFRSFVESVFDDCGRELSRWSLKGMLDEFAGESVTLDREALTDE